MKRLSVLQVISVLCTLALIASCQTVRFEVRDDMTQAEYFQRAQEAADVNGWDIAHSYYAAFIEKFPDDIPNIVAAEYEMSFIKMKQGKYDEARQGLSALLKKYETGFTRIVPEWPRVLSEKLLKEMPETPAAKTTASKG